MTRSPEARIKFIRPEIPTGETLLQKVTGYAMLSLPETYSVLNKPPFAEKLPTPGSICFASVDQIQKQQKEDKPPAKSKLLYDGLGLSGIPESAIEARYHSSVDEDSPYWNRDLEKPDMYFPDGVLDNLSSPDPGTRVTEAVIFGIVLIRETLEMLPIPKE